jgi:hypothetical protein
MRRPSELSLGELVELVTLLQQELFWEIDDDGNKSWNFEKVHEYKDLLQHLADLMDSFGLAPD